MSADQSNSRLGPHPPSTVPRHVAIVMDGNGRWAQARGLSRAAGHKAGVASVRAIVEACSRAGVKTVTLFAFSSENWQRPSTEVSLLMELFLRTLQRELDRLHRNNIRLRLIGERHRFSSRLQALIAEAERRTAENVGLDLVIAASYGGRWDVTQAAQRLAAEVRDGKLRPEDITPECFDSYLSTAGLAEPDLFIRTGGERRISNFLLWQLAYTELYFTDVLWPDFREPHLVEAFRDFAQRQRRFGRTPEQVEQLDRA